MKTKIWAVLCVGVMAANVDTAVAVPFSSSPGLYTWTTFDFVGTELSSGQNVFGNFSFVTSGPAGDVFTAPVHISGGGSAHFDVDHFFLAAANLNYDDGRFMSFEQQGGSCADTIGAEVGGLFNRSTPCSPTLAPDLAFTLDPDLSFLTGLANTNVSYDVLLAQLLSGPGFNITGRYGCGGGQTSPGSPADFGLNGYCGGTPDVFGRYTGKLTASAVPEPGTLALFGMGLLGAALTRRRVRAARPA